LVSINKVNLHRAWIVLGWVTVSQRGIFIYLCNQLSLRGQAQWYQPKGGDALRLGSKGGYVSCLGGR